jgi:class I fructose-bisphosphate aldolase
MDSRTGKKIRMGRIFDEQSGNTLVVAYSHGVIMGALSGMRTLDEMQRVTLAMADVDALMVAPGMVGKLEDAFIGKRRPSLFVHFDYQSYVRKVLPYQVGATVELASVEAAMATGADAVMTYMYVGHDDQEIEKLEIQRNAQIARECERLGMVFMAEALCARENTHPEVRHDASAIGLSCRIAAELGADIVKSQYPGSLEAVAEIAETCPSPLLLAGGAKLETLEAAYELARQSMAAGARGLVFGRNIFEADNISGEIQRYRQIVHNR